jgi:hypothetical protein
MIKVNYSSVDGHRQTRSFKTVAGAGRYARRWIGEHPEIGSHYAISSDGAGKITVDGASLGELFPPRQLPSNLVRLEDYL